MSVNLGQVAAILYGTTPPANTNVIWGETTTNDPLTYSVLNFRRYNAGTSSWEIIASEDPDWQTTNW
jgi:hypothetical protein